MATSAICISTFFSSLSILVIFLASLYIESNISPREARERTKPTNDGRPARGTKDDGHNEATTPEPEVGAGVGAGVGRAAFRVGAAIVEPRKVEVSTSIQEFCKIL